MSPKKLSVRERTSEVKAAAAGFFPTFLIVQMASMQRRELFQFQPNNRSLNSSHSFQSITFCGDPASTNVTKIQWLRLLKNYTRSTTCLLYTSDAADEEDSVDLGGRRII